MTINRSAPVLITGSAGRLGRSAGSGLRQAGWQVRGFDRVPTPGTKDFVVGDLTDADALAKAMTGVQTLIHLGATPDDDDFMSSLLPANLVGLHHTLEAARAAGVKRLILASSGQVNWWQQLEGPWPVRTDDPISPRHWYAVTKVAAEAAGLAFARQFGMTVLLLRLGWCPRTREQVEEITASPWAKDVYFSPGDASRFFAQAMDAELGPGCWTLFVSSRPVQKIVFDLEPTKSLLGWEPLDQWPAGAEQDLNS